MVMTVMIWSVAGWRGHTAGGSLEASTQMMITVSRFMVGPSLTRGVWPGSYWSFLDDLRNLRNLRSCQSLKLTMWPKQSKTNRVLGRDFFPNGFSAVLGTSFSSIVTLRSLYRHGLNYCGTPAFWSRLATRHDKKSSWKNLVTSCNIITYYNMIGTLKN